MASAGIEFRHGGDLPAERRWEHVFFASLWGYDVRRFPLGEIIVQAGVVQHAAAGTRPTESEPESSVAPEPGCGFGRGEYRWAESLSFELRMRSLR